MTYDGPPCIVQFHYWCATHVERFDAGDVCVDVCCMCGAQKTATMNRAYRQLYIKPVNPFTSDQ